MVIELPNHSRSFLKAARRESLSSEGFMFEGCYMKPDMLGDSGVGGGGGLTRVRESIHVSPAKCLLRRQYRRLPTHYCVYRKNRTYYSSRSHSLGGGVLDCAQMFR